MPLSLYLHRLLEPNSSAEIANYPIYKILFCVRGHDGTPESDCFAFTESHHNTEIFRIHVFRCQIREAVRIQPQSFNQLMKERRKGFYLDFISVAGASSPVFPVLLLLKLSLISLILGGRVFFYHNC